MQQAVHQPRCDCSAENDYRLREFWNGGLHIYRVCTGCGVVAQSPVKRESIPLSKWRELLVNSGREVVPL